MHMSVQIILLFILLPHKYINKSIKRQKGLLVIFKMFLLFLQKLGFNY